MRPGHLPIITIEPGFELSAQTKALLLLSVLLVLAGLSAWAGALVLQESALRDDRFRVIGAAALAAAMAGLLAGAWGWRCWRRDGDASRIAATRLNWFHAVMSEANRLILRRPNPFELFEGVCEVCISTGHMDLVVIDLSDARDAHRAATATLAKGSTHLPPQLLLEGALMHTLMMTLALRSGGPIVVADTSTDERLIEARGWCSATGIQSLAAIPLRRGGSSVGIVLLHSAARAFFDGQVTQLLAELGADLSFALDNADRERERLAASDADHARKMAEHANRAKTEFLAQMSHELRTPLNAMLGFAQLLGADTEEALSPTQAERVRLITHAGWHLLGLVNDVMDISRIESGRFEVNNIGGDVSSVLDEAIALIQPLARTHQVELSERAASKFGIGATADPRRLQQVLLNLLSNACKYNRPGGHVRVDVTHAGAEVFLDVIDNGVGMTQEQLSHLFEPFNRLGNEGSAIEGSGIGLTLTRQLVEMMKGRLEIDSNPGAGTRARVALPAYAIPLRAAANQVSNPRTDQKPQHIAVVLYIEDDPVNQMLVEQMLLRFESVHLFLADTGSAGIALARERKPDLVLLDMNLPDMTGFDVLAALRADPDTAAFRVVAVSANAMPLDVASAMEFGVLDYWTKPLELDAFLAGVSMLLQVRVDGRRSSASHANQGGLRGQQSSGCTAP